MNGPPPAGPEPRGGDLVRRHRLSTRIWHWTNAVTLLVMLMSGLMIFNAHPRLYWGEYGANFDTAWLDIGATTDGRGTLRIGALRLETTGVLGVWTDPDGIERHRAFPWWATIPSRYSLADARIWHLAFAWVLAGGLLVYLLWSLANGHLRRDIHITAREWRPSHIWHDVRDHARLCFPAGAAALRYNVLQKLAYAAVLFALIPLMIATGLAMSPGTDAWAPVLTEMFGGRQSARSIHFLCAFALVGFFVVHIVMVLLAGPFNEVRAMITGRYRVPREKAPVP
ncbi:cytochrome b/b6 domain-containing protein [Novosphingobium album (ex Liu et al. 2023)]|uniref:Cytochrome b/b6 domain-containing protein n=1 Tax=Novosphingobium album (ex Liu et al. 2023) TaxID=3031130 RepID=A0ABT5WQP0_9SPHN|nr:cytochrome b/b6 domain-containing protein [Novosphingobium album (ex Liu et al. 2023)]MDE8652358.1 cytochrome b/b6 domain-containing protein [Novosphingobium album (ex Liu et al. 2023)]